MIVASDNEPRPGLPQWLNTSIPVVRESDLENQTLSVGVTDLVDSGRLITHRTTIRVRVYS